MKLFDEKGLLNDQGREIFKKIGANTSCECPHHLVEIFETVQKFTLYQQDCLKNSPQDEYVHNWLFATSKNFEHLLSGTIMTLARLEGLLDENNEFKGEDEL